MARGKYQKKKQFNGLPIIAILLVLFLVFAIMLLANSCRDSDDFEDKDGTSQHSSGEKTSSPEKDPTTPSTTPIPTDPYVVSTATVGASGDFLMHLPVINACLSGNAYDFSELFTYVKDYYTGVDFMAVNLETTLGSLSAGAYSGYPMFNCPDEIIDGMKSSGVDLVLTANNHTYDTSHHGFIRTQQVIEEKGLLHLGTKLSEETPNYIVQELNGIQVGMVCYTYETGDYNGCKTLNGIPVQSADTNLLNSFDYNDLESFYNELEVSLEEMDELGAEATMIFIHWGYEYYLQENADQRKIAQQLCELGFDVIVGGHAHVIEPFTTLTSSTGHETYCIYSVGNAISNQNRNSLKKTTQNAIYTEDGMIFTVTFEKWSDGSVNVKDINIIPTWSTTKVVNGQFDYHIVPLDPNAESWSGDFSSTELANSYKRTMSIVGEGLNAYKEANDLPLIPMERENP